MSKVISFSLLILTASAAYGAVKIVRTGGDALFCDTWREERLGNQTIVIPTGKKYLALDIASNKEYRDLEPKTDDLTGDDLQRAQQLVERLRWLDPQTTDLYLKWLNEWAGDRILEENLYDDIDDSANFAEGFECEKIQVIIQEVENEDVRYLISAPIWRQMDVNHRAFMIVHEVIYRDAARHGHQNSFFVAYLNALISSNSVHTMTRNEYLRVRMELGF